MNRSIAMATPMLSKPQLAQTKLGGGVQIQAQRSSVAMNASAAMPLGGSSSMGGFSNLAGSSMPSQSLGSGSSNLFGDMASKIGTSFEGVDRSQFTQQAQSTPRIAETFTPNQNM